jgi:spore coat polysaccharide biosynthesis protein SpsF
MILYCSVKYWGDELAMKVVATIEARMRSTRLPGKVLMKIMGRPMLELLIERLSNSPGVDQVVVATTDHSSCDPIEALANRLDVGCYRGSEDDVLMRVLDAAHQFEADIIVQTTGDNPLIDPEIVGQTLKEFLEKDLDFYSNQKAFPIGMNTRIFPTAVLDKVAQLTNDPVDHEHVSSYIPQHPELFRVAFMKGNLTPQQMRPRLTVDTQEDFELISRIFNELYPKDPKFSLNQIKDLFERQPELLEINQHVQQKKVY